LGGNPPPALRERWAAHLLDPLPDLLAYEGAGIWLFRRLRVLGILDGLAPAFRERLKSLAFDAAARGMQVEEEALTVLGILRGAGIPVVLIKGVARRALARQVPFLDARATSDVDLLVPADRIQEGQDLLLGHGYSPTPTRTPGPGHHHMQGLWNERRVAVELHRSTSARIPPALAWSRAMTGGQALEWAGIPVRVPSATEISWAAITHALNDAIVHGYRLQHFLEVAALAAVPGEVDWRIVMERTGVGEAYEETTGKTYSREIILRWIDGALQLVALKARPAGAATVPLDLASLLRWRLTILEAHRRLGRSLSERLLDEGARALIGLEPAPLPPDIAGLRRLRRRVAAGMSRVAFQGWRRMST